MFAIIYCGIFYYNVRKYSNETYMKICSFNMNKDSGHPETPIISEVMKVKMKLMLVDDHQLFGGSEVPAENPRN